MSSSRRVARARSDRAGAGPGPVVPPRGRPPSHGAGDPGPPRDAGTRDGGPFVTPAIVVVQLDDDLRVDQMDVFPDEDLDAAGRFAAEVLDRKGAPVLERGRPGSAGAGYRGCWPRTGMGCGRPSPPTWSGSTTDAPRWAGRLTHGREAQHRGQQGRPRCRGHLARADADRPRRRPRRADARRVRRRGRRPGGAPAHPDHRGRAHAAQRGLRARPTRRGDRPPP